LLPDTVMRYLRTILSLFETPKRDICHVLHGHEEQQCCLGAALFNTFWIKSAYHQGSKSERPRPKILVLQYNSGNGLCCRLQAAMVRGPWGDIQRTRREELGMTVPWSEV